MQTKNTILKQAVMCKKRTTKKYVEKNGGWKAGDIWQVLVDIVIRVFEFNYNLSCY